MLSDVNVALGVTGSVAAVRVVELAHELRRRGATVRPIMTSAATNIIHPWAAEFGTEHTPITEITGAVEHVELCGRDGWADVLLIAPATANTIGKIAAGIDDTPVTTAATTAIGADAPVVIAPAMHEPMYDHPGVLDAIDTLESWDIPFVAPRVEENKAKMATVDTIALETACATTPDSLADTEILLTTGGTAERIDPIRVLTNRSSGQMGRAIARSCYIRGADLTVVHGSISMRHPSTSGLDERYADPDLPYASVIEVETAAEMRNAVFDHIDTADCFISAAAISDYTVDTRDEKLKSGPERTLQLHPTPKLVDQVRDEYPDLPIVGFKTETTTDSTALIEAAKETMERAELDCVIANDASVMGAQSAHVHVVTDSITTEYSGDKSTVGDGIAAEISAIV